MSSDIASVQSARKRSQSFDVFGSTSNKVSHGHRRCKSVGSLTLDIKDLTREDFKALHAADPFMYYSIPAVRKAALKGEDVDFSDAAALCMDDTQEADTVSESESSTSNTKVLRRSLISFEADPMYLMSMLLDDEDEVEDDDAPTAESDGEPTLENAAVDESAKAASLGDDANGSRKNEFTQDPVPRGGDAAMSYEKALLCSKILFEAEPSS